MCAQVFVVIFFAVPVWSIQRAAQIDSGAVKSATPLVTPSPQVNAREYTPATEKIYIERYTIDDGLPNNAVRSMVQDARGFLWVATEYGLCRFDGRSFIVYRHDERDSTTISANTVHALFFDQQQRLWVGTENGLCRYEPRSNSFVRYRSASLSPEVKWVVNQIVEDASGLMLVASFFGGIYVLNPATKEFVVAQFFDERGVVDVGRIRSAGIAGGTIWAVSYTGEIYTAGREQLTTKERGEQMPRVEFRLAKPLYAGLSQLGTISFQQGETVWIATERGVFEVDVHNRQCEIRRCLLADALNRSTGRLQACLAVSKRRNGELWVGTDDGVYVFDEAYRLLRRHANDPVDLHSMGSNLIYCFLEDRSGVVWIGEGIYGLNKYAPHLKKFQWFKHEANNPLSISDNYIRGMTEDRSCNIWVCTQFGGLNRFHPATRSFTRIVHDATKPRSLYGSNVRTIIQDHTGLMWVGGWGMMGLQTFRSGLSNSGRDILFTTTYFAGFPKKFDVNVLCEDRAKRIWVGFEDDKLYCISADRRTTQIFPFEDMQNNRHSVQSILEDKTGRLWVATTNGLYWLDSASHSLKVLRHNAGDAHSLPNNFVTFLGETRLGELWLATKGGGIARYNAAHNNFDCLTESDGLAHNNCYAVLDDEQGHLWVSTDNGLCRIDLSQKDIKKRFIRFDVSDGLQGKEFNRHAFVQTRNGELWFGGVNGVNAFHPRDITKNNVVPLVEVVRLQADSLHRVLFGVGEVIKLPSNYNNFRVTFAALEFTEPLKNQFSWYLEGLEKTWSPPTTSNEAVYNNLSPSEYVLHVKAANSDGAWNELGTTLTIVIQPAWWQTWWFRALAVIAGIGLVVVVVTVRQRQAFAAIEQRNTALERVVEERTHEIRVQMELVDVQSRQMQSINTELEASNWELVRTNELLEEKNKELEDLNKQKNEIVGIVSHDLKNPLSAIIGLSSMMQDDSTLFNPQEMRAFAEQISKSADRMLLMVKNLLNANAVESGNFTVAIVPFHLPTLIESVVANYIERAAAKSITIHYTPPPAATDVELASYMVLADESLLFQVVDNLISNALKFTPLGKNVFISVGNKEVGNKELNVEGETAEVSLPQASNRRPNASSAVNTSLSTKTVCMFIRDEGSGIAAAEQDKLFSRFTRLSAQPTGGEHSTGLGLSIVRRLVTAMNGHVWCESAADRGIPGATFIVELPLATRQAEPLLLSRSADNDERV